MRLHSIEAHRDSWSLQLVLHIHICIHIRTYNYVRTWLLLGLLKQNLWYKRVLKFSVTSSFVHKMVYTIDIVFGDREELISWPVLLVSGVCVRRSAKAQGCRRDAGCGTFLLFFFVGGCGESALLVDAILHHDVRGSLDLFLTSWALDHVGSFFGLCGLTPQCECVRKCNLRRLQTVKRPDAVLQSCTVRIPQLGSVVRKSSLECMEVACLLMGVRAHHPGAVIRMWRR